MKPFWKYVLLMLLVVVANVAGVCIKFSHIFDDPFLKWVAVLWVLIVFTLCLVAGFFSGRLWERQLWQEPIR